MLFLSGPCCGLALVGLGEGIPFGVGRIPVWVDSGSTYRYNYGGGISEEVQYFIGQFAGGVYCGPPRGGGDGVDDVVPAREYSAGQLFRDGRDEVFSLGEAHLLILGGW